jgi:hypothetical protein
LAVSPGLTTTAPPSDVELSVLRHLEATKGLPQDVAAGAQAGAGR